MNQSELAFRIGHSRFAVNHILKGRRNASATLALKLVKAVPGTVILDWLFAKRNHKRLDRIVRSLDAIE